MIAYKFISQRYAEAFISGASIRVGTLADFRNVEDHQRHIGDDMEGRIKALSGTVSTQDLPDSQYLARLKQWGGINIQGAGEIRLSDNQAIHEVPDSYIMSFSTEFDRSIWNTLPEGEASYDCALMIKDIHVFAEIVANAMEPYLDDRRFITDTVQYKSRSFDLTKGNAERPSPFVKDIVFAGQKEFRINYAHPKRPVSPRLIQCNIPSGLIVNCARR